MRISFFALLLAVAVAIPALLDAQAAMPRMTTVEPETGKVGDVLVVNGEHLEKTQVAELFLTDGKNDVKVPVVEQTATAIKFKIPDAVKPGRFALMILTTGNEPKLIEQPVKVTVE